MKLKRLLQPGPQKKKKTSAERPAAEEEAAKPKAKEPSDKAQSSRVLNRIIDTFGFTDYLEIGVQKGITFTDVTAARRDAVDPNFLFDTAEHASDDVRFFEMPSDEFFLKHCDKTYDLIFIDGLHTAEQCFRDFSAALQVLREPGVILIDDTVPGDFFSTLRTQDDAIEVRKAHGLSGRAWTGDVFKVVLMLHEFYPNLDFNTLTDGTNPAYKPNTLVWRDPRDGFSPRGLNFGQIQSVGYFDLPDHEALFRYAEMDDGLSRLFKAKSVG